MLSEVAEQDSLKLTMGEGRETRPGGQAPADVVSGRPLLSDQTSHKPLFLIRQTQKDDIVRTEIKDRDYKGSRITKSSVFIFL